MQRRTALTFLFAAIAGTAGPTLAQSFPTKPVRLFVGSAAGSTPDLLARSIGQKLTELWGGVPVVVENRPGAAGTLAADAVVRSAPDGYTLLLSDNSTWSIDPHLYRKLSYDPSKQLAPVVQVATLPAFLVVNQAVPVNNLAELIAYAKQNPGKMHYGSAGAGSMHHLSGEVFKTLTGTDIVHVPYKGAPQVATALMAGEVQVGFMGLTGASGALAAGKVKVLGVGLDRRLPALPNVPTLEESGLRGFDMSATVGIHAPAGTPDAVLVQLASSVNQVLRGAELADRLAQVGVVPNISSTPAQFARTVRADYDKFGALVKQTGATVD
jgi:tripartite-type tricarboxylate transporter receptor subunit TctC